jgi:uncharacterized membrane protein
MVSETNKLVALIFQEAARGGVYQRAAERGQGVAVAIAEPTLATAALDEIEKRAKEAGVEIKDAVIAFKTGEGRIKIRQTKDMTAGKGARRGSFWGLVVGLVLGGPLFGILAGLGIGAIAGRRIDHGLDDEFISRVSRSLKPTTSALLVLIDEEHAEGAIAYLGSFDAEMYVSDMSQEAEEALDEAAGDEAIAQAVESEFGAE